MLNKTMVVIALGVALVSLASAGLVGFLSNSVSGSVEVLGPVFYLDTSHHISVNVQPSNSGQYTITGSESEYFETQESYDGIDFYKPEIKFSLDLEVNNLTEPRGIDLEFGYIKTGGSGKTICEVQYISITENGILEVECPLVDEALADLYYYPNRFPEEIDEFYIEIEGMGSEDIVYKIKKPSYVQITGVRDE